MRPLIALIATAAALLGADLPLGTSTIPLPAGWTTVGKDPVSVITPTHAPHIQVWTLTDVVSVETAVAQVVTRITPQVTEFKAVTTTATTVAGHPAVHLTGTGTEADDGDPSNVEVDIFRAGGQTMLLLSHGEGAGPGATKATIDALLAALPKS